MDKTLEQPRTRPGARGDGVPVPGLVLIFGGRTPQLRATALVEGSLEIGRGEMGSIVLEDGAVSRRHARVSYDGKCWRIEDLQSRNGTFVDGAALSGEIVSESPRCVRVGTSIFILVRDVRRFLVGGVEDVAGALIGPTLQSAHRTIAQSARFGDALHVTGESGAGKELAARAFHAASARPNGPFIAVNCAAIPEGLAERLLFGARKGAYSGATGDSEGYLQAADGGTVFLDEVAELDLGVQAKLLRVLETREVLPLGASRPRSVEIRICSATHRGLRSLVASGEFREDLYFRIGRPEVALPPLRERLEEIPYLIERALRAVDAGLYPRPSFLEACLLRRWPGNVRELLTEVRDAGRRSLLENEQDVEAGRLSPEAGMGFGAIAEAGAAAQSLGGGGTAGAVAPPPSKQQLEDALRAQDGNVARTARALNVHRTQLRRWLTKHNLDPRSYGGAAVTSEDEGG